jgi:hypothetical protein
MPDFKVKREVFVDNGNNEGIVGNGNRQTAEIIAVELSACYGKFLSKKELSSYLKISKATLDRLIASGEGIPYFKRNKEKRGRVYYYVRDIADYIAQTRILAR